MNRDFTEGYAEFRRTFCHLEDGRAADRVDWLTNLTGPRLPLRAVAAPLT